MSLLLDSAIKYTTNKNISAVREHRFFLHSDTTSFKIEMLYRVVGNTSANTSHANTARPSLGKHHSFRLSENETAAVSKPH